MSLFQLTDTQKYPIVLKKIWVLLKIIGSGRVSDTRLTLGPMREPNVHHCLDDFNNCISKCAANLQQWSEMVMWRVIYLLIRNCEKMDG